jgi:aspartate carbamoyltransferase regulatory subunit
MIELDTDSTNLLAIILIVERNNIPSQTAKLYADYQEITKLTKLIEKRISVMNLPILEPTALMALTLIAPSAGKCVLGLIETFEKVDLLKPEKITAHFICENVYPNGFYEDEEFNKKFEFRKAHRENSKYNFII